LGLFFRSEFTAEKLSRAVKARANRARNTSERRCCFFVSETFEIAQNDDFAVSLRQSGDGTPEREDRGLIVFGCFGGMIMIFQRNQAWVGVGMTQEKFSRHAEQKGGYAFSRTAPRKSGPWRGSLRGWLRFQ
jgi:hypothetical protein